MNGATQKIEQSESDRLSVTESIQVDRLSLRMISMNEFVFS